MNLRETFSLHVPWQRKSRLAKSDAADVKMMPIRNPLVGMICFFSGRFFRANLLQRPFKEIVQILAKFNLLLTFLTNVTFQHIYAIDAIDGFSVTVVTVCNHWPASFWSGDGLTMLNFAERLLQMVLSLQHFHFD